MTIQYEKNILKDIRIAKEIISREKGNPERILILNEMNEVYYILRKEIKMFANDTKYIKNE